MTLKQADCIQFSLDRASEIQLNLEKSCFLSEKLKKYLIEK